MPRFSSWEGSGFNTLAALPTSSRSYILYSISASRQKKCTQFRAQIHTNSIVILGHPCLSGQSVGSSIITQAFLPRVCARLHSPIRHHLFSSCRRVRGQARGTAKPVDGATVLWPGSKKDDADHMQIAEQPTSPSLLRGPSTHVTANAPSEERSGQLEANGTEGIEQQFQDQLHYLRTVRDLEEKLGRARHNLHQAIRKTNMDREANNAAASSLHGEVKGTWGHIAGTKKSPTHRQQVNLKKEDFLDLVDLYFYSHRSRFVSELPDHSPTPLQIEDYSFKVSEDFTTASNSPGDLGRDMEETSTSPLDQMEIKIKSQNVAEIKAYQRFVDLLMDDYSPLRDLFIAYKALPQPGVSYLPKGVIRLFLQRMSTPWRKSESAMLRYLSLIDDMQHAKLPITPWEWSSAIHLAGHSFPNVSNTDVAAAFRVWRQMEKECGVASRDVTFNILFDIAVKAEKFVLAEEVLKEMHERGFRLNRLGRVSLIYYYGRKKDGDGVRKAYRDFVEAGEIVDTLVLNCVMASLINAEEPTAAEQVYERMKGMQEGLRRQPATGDQGGLFTRYPPPGSDRLGTEAASNSLGRVLLHASRLKTMLPEHHAQLQDVMPLTPNAMTFRILMTHHARTSGNLDRLIVLVAEMTNEFGIPFSPLTFQTLFMGFARHGGSSRAAAKWTRPRLQITFTACLVCLKSGKEKNLKNRAKHNESTLPDLENAVAMAATDEATSQKMHHSQQPLRPSAWSTFIKQFVSPYPQSGTLEMYPTSELFPDLPPCSKSGCGDDYTLPSTGLTPENNPATESPGLGAIYPTKHLIMWVLRAFARCTEDRKVVEDVWYQLRRVWRPVGSDDRAIAVRELRRALVYCDTHTAKASQPH